ncbi:hypothetical protein ACFL20_10730, partial [Spirochaetota bacterium]
IEIEMEFAKSFLQFSDYLDIKYVTFHATKACTILSSEDYNMFKKKINELVQFIEDNSLSVKIAVETGGILPKQLIDLENTTGVSINLDTAHLVLDLEVMQPECSHFKINQQVTKFFKNNYKRINQLHLTQTKLGDQHLPINEDGIVSCNKDILRLIQKFKNAGQSFLTMIESEITSKDREYVKQAVSDVQYFGYGNAVVNIIMGWPLGGKSTGSEVLQGLIGPVVRSDKERLYYHEAISQKEVVPENKKNRVYSELLDRLTWNIKKGNPESNIEATFTLKSRRDKLFNILTEASFKDLYLWCFTLEEDDVRQRIQIREAQRDSFIKEGKEYPENILVDYEIYNKFINDNELGEKHTRFEVSEIPQKLEGKAHIALYNTSQQSITMYNADDTLRKGVRMLCDYAVVMHLGTPEIKEL